MSEVEVLDAPVHLVSASHPLSLQTTMIDIAAGATIAELIATVGMPTWAEPRVYVNGDLVYPEFYRVVRPKHGAHVLVRFIPRGGGYNKNLGNILSGVLLIIHGILALAFPVTAPFGVPLIGAGVGLILTGLINMLIPHEKKKMRPLATSTADAESPTLSIAGQSNGARPYGVVPVVLGRHKIFPPYAAKPYTERVGADQYLRLLFFVGLGETESEEHKIGDTAIENFQGVEMEVRTGAAGEPPLTLYTTDVSEEPLSIVLLSGVAQIRTSATGAAELSVDIAFPAGLIQFDPNTFDKFATTVSVAVEYRLAGQPTFMEVPGAPIVTREARQGLVRNGIRWKPQRPAGPYGAASWTQLGFASVTFSRFNDTVLNVIAFDADAAGVGSWIELDAGSAVEFGRVLVTSAGTGANATWDIQSSDDHVTWTTQATGFSTGAAGSEGISWPAARARYWRLLKTNGAAAGPDYYEIEWWQTTVGQYDVRLTRTTSDSGSINTIDGSVWSALRTVRLTPPLNFPTDVPIAVTAMRIKATDQLNGIIDQYNCVASSRELDWASYAGSVLADRPLGYWRLGEIFGAPTAFDASGHGRSAPYLGGPTLGAAGLLTGDPSTSMTCDGTDDQVGNVVGSTAIDMGNSSFTIECIVKATNLTGNRGIVHKGDGSEFASAHLGWSLIRAGSVVRFTRAVGSGSPTLLDSNTISAGTIYYIAVVYDRVANTAMMYVNGNLTGPVAMPSAAYADFYAINFCQASDNPWEGSLQEIAVYPTALSAARIAAHYAAAQGTREWVAALTSNPASHYRRVLTGKENDRALDAARLDLAALQAWHDENTAGLRSCNLVVDYGTTVYELLRTIAGTGRATPTMNDDKHAVVRDLAQTVPRQHFTPRNSRGWHSRRIMVDPIHAIRGRFIDPAANWQQSERVVYADGYSAQGEVPGTVPATKFEVMDFHGVTDPDQVWRLCRYNIAVAQLRPESHDFETDVEYLVTRRGDLVRVAHDVLENGLAWGRIKSVTGAGPVTAITVDETFTMQGTSSYVVRIRLSDGTSLLAPINTVVGGQTTVTFTTPVSSSPLPAAGDLVLFGLAGLESREVVIARIQPGPDLSARLIVVDAAPAVLTADQGTIPPWDPQMSSPPDLQLVPPTPIVDSVVSDETVLLRDIDGSLASRIVIGLHYLPTSNVRADNVEVRWRRVASLRPFETLPKLPPDIDTVSIDRVEDGVAYDIRIRSITRDGLASPWAEVLNHTVIGKTTPPIAPVNLRLVEGTLRWDYPTPPPDLEGFVLRVSPGATGVWSTAIPLHVGVAGSTPFPLPTMYGQWTFLVAAVDTSGNASPPASLTINFGDVRLHNQVATKDYDADGYPGSITNGSVSAGDLKADQLSTGFWTQDGNLFWSASGSTLFWQGTYKEMTYLFSYTTGANAGGTTMYFDTTIVAVAWRLYYRVGTSGDYLPWAGSLTGVLASQQYDFKLVTDAGVVQGVVSRLTLWLDAEDITEHQAGFATAVTTGTRLTLVNTFRSIKQVKPTVVASGAETAITAIAADKQNTAGAGNGPLIKSFDQAGAVVAGHVDVDIVGY